MTRFRGRFCAAAKVHLHASPMTAALTWGLRLNERRDARIASALYEAQHPPAGTRARFRSFFDCDQIRFGRFSINSRDSAVHSSSHALTVVVVVVFRRRRRRRRPARRRWTRMDQPPVRMRPAARRRGAKWSCGGHFPLARLRDDFAAFAADKARTGYAQTASLLFSSPRRVLFLASSFSRPPPGDDRCARDRGCIRAHTRSSRGFVLRPTSRLPPGVYARIMMLSLLTDRRTLPILDVGYCQLSPSCAVVPRFRRAA